MGVEWQLQDNVCVVSAELKVDAVECLDSAIYKFLARARLEDQDDLEDSPDRRCSCMTRS